MKEQIQKMTNTKKNEPTTLTNKKKLMALAKLQLKLQAVKNKQKENNTQ